MFHIMYQHYEEQCKPSQYINYYYSFLFILYTPLFKMDGMSIWRVGGYGLLEFESVLSWLCAVERKCQGFFWCSFSSLS